MSIKKSNLFYPQQLQNPDRQIIDEYIINQLSKMKINFGAFFLVVLLCAFSHSSYINTQQQVESTTVALNTIVTVNHTANTNKYYQTVVPNPQKEEILLITVASDIQAYIGIFVITSNSPNFVNGTWPDWSSYTQECFYQSLDTCAIQMPDVSTLPDGQTNLTVYITVNIGSQDCTYNLQVSLETIYPISVGKKYGVTFNKIQSAMLQLNGSNFFTSTGQQLQQVVITCTYTSYRDIGHFMVIAEEGQIPNSGQYDVLKSRSLNAMTQILQLDPISANSSYYILLEGQNATKFNFTVQGVESLTNPDLKINQTVSYLAKKPLTYSYHSMFSNSMNSTVLPLYLDLYAYRGFGKFFVDYCNNLHNFTFENTGGQSGQVEIPPQMRQECYAVVTSQGGLLIENLAVSVVDISYEFGYSIGFFEGTFSFFLFPSMKQIGVVQSGNKQTYQVAAYGQSTNLTLVSQALVGSLTVVINQCQQNQYKNGTKYTTCTQITNISLNEANPINKVTFVCQNKSFCQVQVSQPQAVNYSKYSLTLTFTDESMMELLPNKPQFDIVQMNSYVHYYINVTSLRNDPQYQFSNATIINIRNSLVNGETVLLSSTTVQKPIFKDLFSETSDVSYGYEGSATYLINSTYPDYIYIGILGDVQSIYHIQFTLNTSANIPAAYLSMIDDAQNDFVITSSNPYVLTKYVSHIIPYSITFDPMPSCIKYSNKLPITGPCVSPNQMPNVFHQSVLYFNITQTLPTPGAVFKFSAYANSGSYLLSQDRPILIGCQKQCYELITVVLKQSNATILHSGDGRLMQLPDTTNNSVSNGPLTLKCPTSNCTFQLNATMKYGGQMQVAFQSALASQIEWRTKPMTLPAQNQYRYYFMRLLSYSDFNSFIFYSEAADFTVYYNIMALNQTYTNTLDFSYPNSTSFMQVSYGDPLQEIHIVDIKEELIQQYKCKERNIICIVTLAVTLNSSIQYSQQYLYQGLGYYSANTYQYIISTTEPIIKLKQSYSLSYFTHVINFESEQTFFPHTIHIQPLSNCRPQVQTQTTGYIKNFYTDVTLPKVMPGQKSINYRVLSNQVCLFNTALTTIPYQLLFPNIQYNVRVQKNSTQFIAVYQHAAYQSSFTVSLKQAALSIIVGKPTYTSNDDAGQVILNLPSMLNGSNVGYVLNSSTLAIKDADYGQYIIIVNFPSKSALQPIIVNTESYPTILLHNQIHTYVFDPTDNSISAQNSPSFQYEYHSTNNFYIFAQVNRLAVKLTVRDNDNWGDGAEIMTTTITNTSDPWFLVKAKPGSNSTTSQILTNYRIICQFIGTTEPGYKATFKIHIQDEGVIGLTQVYHGVSIYDSFVHDSAMNCYKFHAPMILGQDKMTIDLNFRSKQGYTYNNNKIVTGMASLVQKPTQSLSLKQSQISPSTYRLTLDYFTNSMYKICYTLSSLDMVGVQYSIIVNVPSMPMIYDNQYTETGKIYGDQYGMFEYINNEYDYYYENIEGKPVTFTVTNCLSDNSTVLASSSYNDMQTGKMTQVANSWASAGIETVLISIPHGYYYFGVKSLHPDKYQLFRVNVQPSILIDFKPTILQEQYYINWSTRGKIYTSQANSIQYVNIQVPTIAKSASANNSLTPSKIIYSLYLINLKTNQSKNIPYKYSIDAYTRCPSLYERANGTQLKPIQIITLTNPMTSNNAETITFKLNINDFVPDTNISIIAEVFISDEFNNTNVLEYFYGDGEIRVQDSDSGVFSILKWVIIIVFVFSTIGLVAAFIRFYWRRRGRSINFEMAQYPSNSSSPNRRSTQIEPRVVVDTTNTTNTTSNRRPLNGGAGYGEFVDQV